MTVQVIGCEEWCAFPELGLPAVKAKIDSGAKTSALHAFNIKTYFIDDDEYISFDIHPLEKRRNIIVQCKTKLVGRRLIRSSNGTTEMRPIISTTIRLGEKSWEIEVGLSNRGLMGYKLLLGRDAVPEGTLLDLDKKMLQASLSEGQALRYYGHDIDIKQHKPLDIILLASDPALYSNKRIMESGTSRGHRMRFLSVRDCHISIKGGVPKIYHKGAEELINVDAVIPRLRPSVTAYGCALLRHFHAVGAFCLNTADPISHARDKLRSLQTLGSKGLSIPDTAFGHSISDSIHLTEMVGGAPLIIKLMEGAQGTGVMLANNNKSAESIISAFNSIKANILIQEFIEADGEDVRCFVVDGKVIASMKRKGVHGDFRSNLHLGGEAHRHIPSAKQKKAAVHAAKILGLVVAAVDFISAKSGDQESKIVEVNASPGLEGIEKITGLDIGSILIRTIEKKIYGLSHN